MTNQPKVGADAKKAKDTEEEGNGVPWAALFVMAAVLIVVYFIFAFLSFDRADDGLEESAWSRSMIVLLGVESIAFTAVGWLFGREVHRGEAQVAKESAKDAKGEAKVAHDKADAAKGSEADARERAATAATAGQSLADAVRAAVVQPVGGAGGNEALAVGADPAGLSSLKSLADSLFPPR